MGKFLKSEKLVFATPGALTAFRCRFPNVPAVGLAYAVASIQLFLVDPPAPVTVARLQVTCASWTKFGRCAPPTPPTLARLELIDTLRGVPARRSTIAF